MSERVCIIHHLQEMWEEGYKQYGTSFVQESLKMIDYLESEKFDRVILVLLEGINLEDEHYYTGLSDHIDEVQEYAYGWEREWAEENEPDGEDVTWAEGGGHSEVVLLDDWIKSLKGKDVTLTGAFENECIETLSTAMDHCEVEYKREDSLIVGTGVEYVFRSEPEEDLDEFRERVEEFATDQPEIEPFNKKRDIDKCLKILVDTDYKNAKDDSVIWAYQEAMYGASEGHVSYVEGDGDLWIDEPLYEEAEALSVDEADLDDIQSINIEIENNVFIVSEDDYPLLKFYQEIGVDSIPVHIDSVSDDPYREMNIGFEDEAGYQRLQNTAQRKLQSGVNKKFTTEPNL